MSALDPVLTRLRQLGYEAVKVTTFPATGESPDPHHAYAVGRPGDRHVIIGREKKDGSYHVYVPLRGGPEDQEKALADWLKENVEPDEP
jgi:hypothetical protein